MKSAGLNLLFFIVTGILAAQPAEPALPARTSARLMQEIRSALPQYVPPAEAKPASAEPAGPRDPDLLVLPTVTVQEKRLPGNDPDVWLGERVIQQKAMTAYKASMTDLEWALNSWFIPLVTPPASARARSAYQINKSRVEFIRLNGLIQRITELNPTEAAKLRRGLDPKKLPKDD